MNWLLWPVKFKLAAPAASTSVIFQLFGCFYFNIGKIEENVTSRMEELIVSDDVQIQFKVVSDSKIFPV